MLPPSPPLSDGEEEEEEFKQQEEYLDDSQQIGVIGSDDGQEKEIEKEKEKECECEHECECECECEHECECEKEKEKEKENESLDDISDRPSDPLWPRDEETIRKVAELIANFNLAKSMENKEKDSEKKEEKETGFSPKKQNVNEIDWENVNCIESSLLDENTSFEVFFLPYGY